MRPPLSLSVETDDAEEGDACHATLSTGTAMTGLIGSGVGDLITSAFCFSALCCSALSFCRWLYRQSAATSAADTQMSAPPPTATPTMTPLLTLLLLSA